MSDELAQRQAILAAHDQKAADVALYESGKAALDQAAADMAHRDDLARDVARGWTARRKLAEVHGLPPALTDALDRLAAAYGETP